MELWIRGFFGDASGDLRDALSCGIHRENMGKLYRI
jgi:hypothetical protein